MSQKSKFCAVPWNELVYTSQFNYGVCCIWKDDGNLVSSSEKSDKHYNSAKMKDLRRRMLNKEEIPECQACWDNENNNKFSMRMRRNQHYYGVADLQHEDAEIEHILSDTTKDGSYHTNNIHSLHVSTGDKCQLRCIDCSPAYSRSILKDYKKLGWDNNFKSRRLVATDNEFSPFAESAHWESIRQNSYNLKIIRLSGGEPSINRNFIDYLNWLVEENIAQNIEIHIPTNCVNIKNNFLEPLKHFGKTVICLSVDGIGKLDEYLRYPTNWEKKLENINYMARVFPESYIHTVIYSLNVLDIDKIYKWGTQYQLMHSFDMLTFPDELSIRNLPDNLKQIAINKIKNVIKELKGHTDVYNKEEFTLNSLTAILNRLSEPGNPEQWTKCQQIIKGYDTIRKQPLHEICMDMAY